MSLDELWYVRSYQHNQNIDGSDEVTSQSPVQCIVKESLPLVPYKLIQTRPVDGPVSQGRDHDDPGDDSEGGDDLPPHPAKVDTLKQ